MATPPRVPPRFVPTLTDVVARDAAVHAHAIPAEAPAVTPPPAPTVPAPSPAPRAPAAPPKAWGSRPQSPPAQVQVVPAQIPPTAPTQPPSAAPSAMPVADGLPASIPDEAAKALLTHDFEEMLVHRVMQRVDVSLDVRLREAIAAVMQEQTRSMLPRLHEEVESVVRQVVVEAVADELASKSNQ